VEMNSGSENGADLGPNQVTVVTRTAANGMDDSVLPYRLVRQPGLWRLINLIRDADVVHVAGPCLLPMAIGQLLGKPVAVEHHGYQAVCPNGLLFREPSRTVCPGYFAQGQYGKCMACASATMGFLGAIRALTLTFPRRWLCGKVPANITISDHVATRLKLPRSRAVYYGIEKLPNVAAVLPPPVKGSFQVAYVGRLVSEKGPSLLLEAAKRLKDDKISFQLAFLGDGPERLLLEKLTDSLGLRDFTTFTGDLRGSQFEEAVSKIDLVVMPSLCEETAGLSAIEQMMRGRAVIVADIGGLSEVVGDAGLKFPPGDSQALAACIRKVIEDPSMAASLGRAGRDRAVRLFSIESMIRNHISVYHHVA
jgi:glycosyltransferase involved in cell wall biosynthesis